MASPFRYFRKYTGVFMVFLTVLLMVAFGLQDILGSLGGPGGPTRPTDDNEVAVSWEGGKLTNRQLRDMVSKRQLLRAFHENVFQLGYQAALTEGAEDLQLRIAPLNLPATARENVEQDVVSNKVLADAAREAGMVVSDDSVRDYLFSLGRDRVASDQLRAIIAQLSKNYRARLTVDYLFDLVREAMLARNFQQSYAYTFATVMPQQRYRDWLAVNDRVVVEAAGLPIERFLDQVPEPTDDELQAFFDEHKDRQPQPDFIGGLELPSPTPGFASPHRVGLQYVRASFQAAVDELIDQVTDEEVAEYYEENKQQFVKAADLLSGDSLGDDLFGPDEPEMAEGTDAQAQQDDAQQDGAEPTPESEPEATGETQPETDSAAGDEATAGAAPVEEGDADGQAEDAVDPSARLGGSPFRLAAYQPDAEKKTPAADGAEEGSETANAEPGSPETDAGGADADATDQDAASDQDAADEQQDEQQAEEQVEYQPLEEVRDTIRQQLASQRAAEATQSLVTQLYGELKDKFDDYFADVIAVTPEGETPPPPGDELTDLSALAERHDLELVTMNEATLLGLRDTEVGKAVATESSYAGNPIVLVAFLTGDNRVDLYDPVFAVDRSSGDCYIVQKTADYPLSTPELEDVRGEVVAAWKKSKAAEIALEEAKKLAEEAEAGGATLAGFFGGERFAGDDAVEVVETDAFSRLSIGLVNPRTGQVPMQMSSPDPIEAAGPKLLDAVFKLEGTGVAAELNHDRSIAYVVRIARRVETPNALRKDFLSEGGFWFGQATMDQARGQVIRSGFYSDLVGESGFDWKRPPDEVR